MSNPDIIERGVPIPKYYQIQLILQDRIQSGVWTQAQPVPSERDLVQEFEVSRPTIRQALSNLVGQGFLRREQGKGTFVAKPKLVEHTLTPTGRSTYQDWRRQGFRFEARVLSMRRETPSPDVRRKLQLPRRDDIIRIERLLRLEQDPIRHVVTSIPARFCRGILREDLTRQSLTSLLTGKYKLVIRRARQRLQAEPPSVLDMQLLAIPRHSPVFVLECIYIGPDETPIWMDIDHSRADRILFDLETSEERRLMKD